MSMLSLIFFVCLNVLFFIQDQNFLIFFTLTDYYTYSVKAIFERNSYLYKIEHFFIFIIKDGGRKP